MSEFAYGYDKSKDSVFDLESEMLPEDSLLLAFSRGIKVSSVTYNPKTGKYNPTYELIPETIATRLQKTIIERCENGMSTYEGGQIFCRFLKDALYEFNDDKFLVNWYELMVDAPYPINENPPKGLAPPVHWDPEYERF